MLRACSTTCTYLRRIICQWRLISILQITFVALVIVAMHGVVYKTRQCNYKHIASRSIEDNLFRVRNPDLKFNPALAQCSYDFINSTETITSTAEMYRKLREFKDEGIWNGSYAPSDCNPAFSSAVLVTYRNREDQLSKFLLYMHTFLKKQNIHYKIFVIEQHDEKPFKRGFLYNVGARVAIDEKFPCLILHDVDLMPQDAANIYACTFYPRHMSASINKFRYTLPYDTLVGGVTAIQARHFQEVNGFCNQYEGWGGEDDDFFRRIRGKNLHIVRFQKEISRYIMMRHRLKRSNDKLMKVPKETYGLRLQDGLDTIQYESLTLRALKLYTLVRVQL